MPELERSSADSVQASVAAPPAVQAPELEPDVARVLDTVAPRVRRDARGLRAVAASGGGRLVPLEGRYQSVTVARRAHDGQLTASCVDSIEAAQRALAGPRAGGAARKASSR